MRRFAVLFALAIVIPAAAGDAAVRPPAARGVLPTDVDLGVQKSATSNTAAAGSTVAFNITVTNAGPAPAVNTTLTDTLPEGLTFAGIDTSGAAGFTCNNNGNVVTCTNPSFGTGTPANFVLTATVDPQGAPGTTYTNVATVSSDSNDVDSENNTSAAAVTIPTPQADVGVVKSGPATAIPGTDVSYSITVKNNGPDTASNVSFTDTLPGTMTFQSLQPSTNCTTPAAGAGGTITCDIGSLASGATATFTLTGHIPSGTGAGTTFENTASITSSTADPNDENNSSTSSLTVGNADVSIAKSGPGAVNAGSTIAWTITVTNSGPSDASNVTFIDALPSGTTFASVAQNNGPPATCGTPPANSSGNVTCNFGGLVPTATAQFTLTANVLGSAPSTITNTVTISSDTADPNTNNNSSSVTTTVTPIADVGVTKSGPATAVAGTNITYIITVSNAGPSAAANVTLSDPLPPNTTFVSLTQTSGPTFNCTTNSGVNCTIASLPSSSPATFTFVVTASPGATGTISNTATVASSTSDPNGGNTNSTVVTTLSSSADVSVTKSGPAAAGTGSNVTYTITVANAGPSDATNVSMTDTVPANTTFVSVTQTSGPTFTCNTASGTTTCSIATLTSGGSATFSLVTAVSPVAPNGPIANTANVTSSTADSNTGNNSSTATTTISPSIVDLAITKTATTPPPYGTGFPVTYTIVATNNGPNTALGVTVTDVLPAGTTYVSAISTAGTCSGTTTVTCNVGTLAPSASATITLQLTLPPATGPVANTATVTSSSPESNPANNTATATITVIPAADAPALGGTAMVLLAIALVAVALARR